jgi:hypothetical protein
MINQENFPEEQMFDIVAKYLYNGSLQEARKDFYLYLFGEWSKTNFDIILKAITSVESTLETDSE